MHYEKWIPKPTPLHIIYDLVALIDDYDGLSITLSDEANNHYKITWSGKVESYFCNSEEARLDFISTTYKSLKEQFGDWSFYKVRQSEYVNWVSKSSCNLISETRLEHYLIVTKNNLVEVVTYTDPEVISF